MKILCPKCKKLVDPETEMMRCGRAGHEPAVKVDLHLRRGAFVKPPKPPRPQQFQSDFRLVGWGEPGE